ncbi:hypothetical protein IWQ62_004292 [Dispira parvispora]|uniref:DNA helicase n=1 Tax=Dispira parvispora TaxID=1520584 RepID=A0A9W8E5J5_9FUNG|nr:hypothetical protein IWQ62_004292 [Dispira parvispora]
MSHKRSHQTAFSEANIDWEFHPEWVLYFPCTALQDDQVLETLLVQLHQYFTARQTTLNPLTNTVYVHYPDLLQGEQGDTLTNLLINKPAMVLSAMCLALCVSLRHRGLNPETKLSGDIRNKVHIRLQAFEPITPLKSLKSNMVGKLICIRGTVVRTSLVKPLLTQISFVCAMCNRRQTLKVDDGKYTKPYKCTSSGCKSREFLPERGTQGDTQTIDWQRIRIQEKFADDRLDSGRVPRTVECELTHDLVDSVLPGDVVTCTGIVKVIQSNDMGPARGRGQNSMYILYLDAVAISRVGETLQEEINSDSTITTANSEQSHPTAGQGTANANDSPTDTTSKYGEVGSKDAIQFSHKDLLFIQELFQERQLLKLIVNSFCPTIYGNELIKLGILLCQFGGRRRRLMYDNNHIPMRPDPHVLVVGDPGMGKSQMLNAAVSIAPRGVYVCGSSGISACGLTVTICKDSATGDSALEAGK